MLSMNYASKLNYCLIHSLSSFHLNLKVENQWIITCINNASNLKKKLKKEYEILQVQVTVLQKQSGSYQTICGSLSREKLIQGQWILCVSQGSVV